jgi:hypothetical protein
VFTELLSGNALIKYATILFFGTHIGYWWKSQMERPLERPRRTWVDNIEMDLIEIKWDGSDWIDLAQDRDRWRTLVNTVMNLRVP